MIPEITNWKPCEVEAIQSHLGTFDAWCLCGGQSLDWMLGRTTRVHGDTDIGVFRSDLSRCLEAIGLSRVYLCDPPGNFAPWDGADVLSRVNNIWVTDPGGEYWALQVMVYDDTEDHVVYRRDPRIRWNKTAHFITVRGIRILNPVVTLLFKLNKPELEGKDCQDMHVLIEELANHTVGCQEKGVPMEEFTSSPLADAKLEDLAWLEGSWSGQVDGDEVDEVWTGASAGAMMGMFRCVREGKVRFYEFMTITKASAQVDLTIKHFDPALVGWEEKDAAARFVLTGSTGQQAVFHQASGDKQLWLVYESRNGSELRIYFRPIENSPVGDSEFYLRRSAAGAAG
jgi:hypothetical protein